MQGSTSIKIEVNTVSRGLIDSPIELQVCSKIEELYDEYFTFNIVSIGQLYGGKISAALDRQHPRDLFDVKLLLEKGINSEIMKGFIYSLISSERPLHEILKPNLIDHNETLTNHFDGMNYIEFTYNDYNDTRNTLIDTINNSLTTKDKRFILSVNELTPKWDIYDFEKFPSVKWKLLNLAKLKKNKPGKYNEQLLLIKETLNI